MSRWQPQHFAKPPAETAPTVEEIIDDSLETWSADVRHPYSLFLLERLADAGYEVFVIQPTVEPTNGRLRLMRRKP